MNCRISGPCVQSATKGARNITPSPPSRLQLMAILRRANRDDQREAWKWLKDRFDDIDLGSITPSAHALVTKTHAPAAENTA